MQEVAIKALAEKLSVDRGFLARKAKKAGVAVKRYRQTKAGVRLMLYVPGVWASKIIKHYEEARKESVE